jgi:hypothetical protein
MLGIVPFCLDVPGICVHGVSDNLGPISAIGPAGSQKRARSPQRTLMNSPT